MCCVSLVLFFSFLCFSFSGPAPCPASWEVNDVYVNFTKLRKRCVCVCASSSDSCANQRGLLVVGALSWIGLLRATLANSLSCQRSLILRVRRDGVQLLTKGGEVGSFRLRLENGIYWCLGISAGMSDAWIVNTIAPSGVLNMIVLTSRFFYLFCRDSRRQL